MSLDTSLSPGEEAFLASRGANAEALVAENPDLKASYDPGEGKPFVEAERTVETPQEPSPADQGTQEQVDAQGHPKRVTYNKYRQAQERIAQLETENRARAEREVVLDERLRLINEALTEDNTAQVVDEDPAPDPMQDAYAYMEWQTRQRERDRSEFDQYRQQQNEAQHQQQLAAICANDVQNFSRQQPLYPVAYRYLMEHRFRELQVNHPELSHEQRQLVLKQEELGLAQTSVASGLSPSHRIWELARGRGFDSWLAQQQANGGNGAASTYAPSPAPTYAPSVSNGYAPPVPNGGPSAVQQIEAINRGQQAARSLSNAGGASINAFSARDLATMTDDEFAAVFNRLQASGNKARLRELMGT
jgi:hypothetical protein